MAVTINASTSAGLVQTADTSGTLNLQSAGTTILSASPTGVAVTGTLTATGGFPGGGQIQTEVFSAPGTWTKPASCTQVRVTVVGGGGAGFWPSSAGFQAGNGGVAIAMVPVSAPVTITVGAGGVGSPGTGTSGGTSSFGPAVSATGGGAMTSAAAGTPGTGTISVGTSIKTGNTTNVSSVVQGTLLSGATVSIPTILGPAAIAYSPTSSYRAGQGGQGNNAAPATTGNGGIGGAVLVEFVG